MKHIVLFFTAFMLIFTFPVNSYASEPNQEVDRLPAVSELFSDELEDTSVVTSSALDSALSDADDFRETLLDKLDVIIHLLGLIFAACLFKIFAIIAKLFGWIFTNIFKEIL